MEFSKTPTYWLFTASKSTLRFRIPASSSTIFLFFFSSSAAVNQNICKKIISIF
jgi:hypothetical protein